MAQVPLHVQLFRERDVRDARMEERRLLAEEAELEECTFRPKLRSRSEKALRVSPQVLSPVSSNFSRV